MATEIKGIVTRRIDFKENDEIISVFSQELGRVPLLVRGAKRANSRYKALTQLFTYGDFGISQRDGLSLLYQGETIDYFSRLKMNYQAMSHAAYLCELINQVGVDYQPDPELFTWFLTCLQLMDEGHEPEGLTLAFELQILMRLGIALQLSGCAICQSQQIIGFSLAMGGFVCANHAPQNRQQLVDQPLVIKTLIALSRQDVSTLVNIKLPTEVKPILRQVFDQIFEQYSGLYLKSQKFLSTDLKF
ncbi:MAG: DNA repair protein RecO [Culicoidibacterales bacterium]